MYCRITVRYVLAQNRGEWSTGRAAWWRRTRELENEGKHKNITAPTPSTTTVKIPVNFKIALVFINRRLLQLQLHKFQKLRNRTSIFSKQNCMTNMDGHQSYGSIMGSPAEDKTSGSKP
ncbi:hypothetical protein P8452_03562 [Trifolium repens]|nr:hypothetical protein P8452_03562 [Trifolium repens]